jgi:hypothetical protein
VVQCPPSVTPPQIESRSSASDADDNRCACRSSRLPHSFACRKIAYEATEEVGRKCRDAMYCSMSAQINSSE